MEERVWGNESPRRFSQEMKKMIVQEHLEEKIPIAFLARKYQISPVTIYHWKRGVMTNPNSNEFNGLELMEELEKTRRENKQLKKTLADLAMVNRIRGEQPRYNKKRIYRIMRMNGLTFASTGMPRSNYTGTGKVMTLHSNTRWCSDAFEIQCFNRERVDVAFSLDCKDREALG